MLLGKEDILKIKDLKFEEVDVPEWGGKIRVRMMTGTERDSFEQSIMKAEGKEFVRDMTNMRAKLLVRTICDADNKRVFGDKDVDIIGGKAASALEKIFEAAQRLNKLSASDAEELEKNSESEGNGTFISPSQKN